MMQKLMKNWIFTLITCILLAILSVLMFLDGAGVGDLFIGQRIIHVLTAVALAIYVILALCPLVPKYHTRSGRSFLLAEIVILTATVVAQIGIEVFNNIPWLSKLAVCSVLGLALWLRAFVLIVHAYLVQAIAKPAEVPADIPARTEEEKQADGKKKAPKALVRTPLWKLCVYILIGSVGVWQMVRPLIEDRYFVFCIAAAAAAFAIIFAVFTVQNHKALPKKPKKEKKATDAKPEPDLPADPAPILPLPAPAPAQSEAPSEETAEPAPEKETES